MKLKAVHFDDNENPTSATVAIGWDELALIVKILAGLSPAAVTEVLGGHWEAAFERAGEAHSFFNYFHDDGVDDVLRSPGDLALKLGETQARLTADRLRSEES